MTNPDPVPSGGSAPTQEQMKQLEQLAARKSRDSRWQVTEAAFRLGLRLGFQQGYQWAGAPDKEAHGA